MRERERHVFIKRGCTQWHGAQLIVCACFYTGRRAYQFIGHLESTEVPVFQSVLSPGQPNKRAFSRLVRAGRTVQYVDNPFLLVPRGSSPRSHPRTKPRATAGHTLLRSVFRALLPAGSVFVLGARTGYLELPGDIKTSVLSFFAPFPSSPTSFAWSAGCGISFGELDFRTLVRSRHTFCPQHVFLIFCTSSCCRACNVHCTDVPSCMYAVSRSPAPFYEGVRGAPCTPCKHLQRAASVI